MLTTWVVTLNLNIPATTISSATRGMFARKISRRMQQHQKQPQRDILATAAESRIVNELLQNNHPPGRITTIELR